jgi:hypothetical protein
MVDQMPSPITQLQPFNEHRFDDCMAYLSSKHGRVLSRYEMMKLHVMIDVHHVLDNGIPVIGGEIWPYTNGPVIPCAFHRVSDWIKNYEQTGETPDCFTIAENSAERYEFGPKCCPDKEDFSESEIAAMEAAWNDVIPVLVSGFDQSQRYFHEESPIGEAWEKASQRGGALDWEEIFELYSRKYDHSIYSHTHGLIRL